MMQRNKNLVKRKKKLELHRETLRKLSERELEGVAGGMTVVATGCNTGVGCIPQLDD